MSDDALKAKQYQEIADSMRCDAIFYKALATEVIERPELLTFASAYADGLRRRYLDLAEFAHEASYQAQQIADDYLSHSNGSYVPLRAV